MSDLAIRAEGLGKRYRIGGRHQAYSTLRESAVQALTFPVHAARRVTGVGRRGGRSGSDDGVNTIWALRDVGFEVRHGEALAILGRNGAGKSTLLKVLSRITEPTTGRAVLEGRVGSLLEVGTGFHQELTGRENIFLNGAILGMSRHDIRRRFDAIVDFSGVEKFLDTPVKRYSSGMHMRLAFAVAAHLEPDILVVDEVLAVGDVEFQKKCLGKMNEVAGEGRTVLFVSHNMAAAAELCRRGLLLQDGTVAASGSVHDVIKKYLTAHGQQTGRADLETVTKASRASGFHINAISVRNPGQDPSGQVYRREGIEVTVEYELSEPIRSCHLWVELENEAGVSLLNSGNRDRSPLEDHVQQAGRHALTCCIPADFLREGMYYISAGAKVPNVRELDYAYQALSFDVRDLDSAEAILREGRRAAMYPVLDWRYERPLVGERTELPA